MRKFLATAAAVAAMGMGSAALAQSAMSGGAMPGDAMHGDAMHSAMGAMPTAICRPARKDEMANTHMGTDDLVCKKFDFDKAKMTLMKMLRDASASGAPTQAQIDAAYDKAYGDMNLLGQHG